MTKGIKASSILKMDKWAIMLSETSLNEEEKKKFRELENELVKLKGKRNISYKKGKIFEEIIELVLNSPKIFKVSKNKRTTSNEIDFLLTLNNDGKLLRAENIIPKWLPNEIIVECKNYSKPIKVDYVGKFYSLMCTSDIRLGLFISNPHITGRNKKNWEDSSAFVNKINLMNYSYENDDYRKLLDIDYKTIKKLCDDDYNIIDLIDERKKEIITDIVKDTESEISNHENESFFKKTK